MTNDELPTSPQPSTVPTYVPNRTKELEKLCISYMDMNFDFFPDECHALAQRICRMVLNPTKFPKNDVHDHGHKWSIRHFTVGQTLRVSPADITNVRRSAQRLQQAHNMKFTTAKQHDGYYLVRRVA